MTLSWRRYVQPSTIAEVADDRVAEPQVPLCKSLSEFLDAFYEVDGDAAMLSEEPTAEIAKDEAAYLAGATEYLSTHYGLVSPEWVLKPRYFLTKPFFPGPMRSPVIDAMCTIESPHAFRRRLVFVEHEPLRRTKGPRTIEQALRRLTV